MLDLCLRNTYVIIDPFIMSQHGNYSMTSLLPVCSRLFARMVCNQSWAI